MSEQVNDSVVEEKEPTPEELELMATKQLLVEIQMIKGRIYESGTLMNGMLIMQVKFLLNGLMNKYKSAGFLLGESVELKVGGRGKHASLIFKYSPGIQKVVDQLRDDAFKAAQQAAQAPQVDPPIPEAKLVDGQWQGKPLSEFPNLKAEIIKAMDDGKIQFS